MSADLVTWFREQLAADEAAEHCKRKWGADTFTKRCPRCHMRVEEIEGTFHRAGVTLLPCRDELTRDEWEVFVDMQPGADEFRLAEIAAARAILDLHPIHPNSTPGLDDPELIWCGTCHDYREHGAVQWPCRTLRALVGPYAGRAGFDPSWLD